MNDTKVKDTEIKSLRSLNSVAFSAPLSLRRSARAILVSLTLGLFLTGACLVTDGTAGVTPRMMKRTLSNGIKLLLIEQAEQPILSIRVVIRAGSKYEPPGKSGLAAITIESLMEGAGKRDAQDFQRTLDSLGVETRLSVSRDVVTFSFLAHSRERFSIIGILKDVLLEPRFPEASIGVIKKRRISGVYQRRDVPFVSLPELAFMSYYPDHPFGTAPDGLPENIERLTHRDVVDFHQKHFSADRISIIVAGDLDSKSILYELKKALMNLPRRSDDRYEPPLSIVSENIQILLVDYPNARAANVGLFSLSGSSSSEFFPAEEALSHILGGNEDISLLGDNLVVRKGLVSNMRLKRPYQADATLMGIQMECASDVVVEVIESALETINLVKETRISKRELEECKRFFRGYYSIGFETADMISSRLAEAVSAGLDHKFYDVFLKKLNSITQNDLRQAAGRMFSTDNFVIVVAGNASDYESDLEQFGQVKTISFDNDSGD